MIMTDLTVRTLGDSTKKIAPETVVALRSNLRSPWRWKQLSPDLEGRSNNPAERSLATSSGAPR